MSIRYECVECGSVLKIKESLAGTSGKCPKCRRKFVVPEATKETTKEPAAENEAAIDEAAAEPAASSEETAEQVDSSPVAPPPVAPKVREKPSAPVQPSDPEPVVAEAAPAPTASPEAEPEPEEQGDDFDLDSFLSDESAPGAKSSAGLSAPPPAADAAPAGPVLDKFGRRMFSPSSTAKNPADADMGSTATISAAGAREIAASANGTGKTSRRFGISFDLKSAAAQLKKYSIHIVLGTIAIGAIAWLSNKVMAERLPVPKLAEISGKVTLDGKPLPNVVVHLTSLAAATGDAESQKLGVMKFRDSIGVTNEAGEYRLEYLPGHPGAPIGRARLWIEPVNPAEFLKLPAKNTVAGTDIRDVKLVGNEGKFDLDVKTP
ncbi:hypothetical protein SH668x_003787 [Planctomicrobium sp. SH668]|uniref:hypothetical protein n=1 Tax=Planctomicrobium sp. SH668 TaxID=3448126 RepID=UPI003F5C2101